MKHYKKYVMRTQNFFLFFTIICTHILVAQQKSDEWHLTASSRENYFGVSMANGQIGIVTDDSAPVTPKTEEEVDLYSIKNFSL